MLRCTFLSRIRVPVVRRRQERFYEVFNQRNFGKYERASNPWSKVAALVLFAGFMLFELALQTRTILARGDTCPACEAARATHRAHVREREELEAIQRDYQAKTEAITKSTSTLMPLPRNEEIVEQQEHMEQQVL